MTKSKSDCVKVRESGYSTTCAEKKNSNGSLLNNYRPMAQLLWLSIALEIGSEAVE